MNQGTTIGKADRMSNTRYTRIDIIDFYNHSKQTFTWHTFSSEGKGNVECDVENDFALLKLKYCKILR